MKRYLSKVLRVIVVFCIMVSMSCQLCACSKKTELPAKSELPDKSDMLLQIIQYKEQAKFTSAFEVCRKMKEYNYITDYELASYEKDYKINSFVCSRIRYVVDHLKKELKDPNSLVIYGVKTEMSDKTEPWDKGEKTRIKITFDYGAKNSFGGMVRENYVYHYVVTDGKDYWDDVKYAVEHHEINKESQLDAIINGTAEYDIVGADELSK